MVFTAACGPAGPAFAWMVPGELALVGLDERERTKEWAAGRLSCSATAARRWA